MKEKKKHLGLRITLGIIGGLILAVILTFAVMMYVIPAFEKADTEPVAGSEKWMASLDDARLISEVVLPGTHDSATKYVQLAFFSKCQSLSVGEQLKAGFRYLDVRLGMEEGQLKLMHGFTNCTESGWPWSGPLYLRSVLTECYDFLNANPTEFIVFVVKKEHGNEPVEAYQSALNALIQQNPEQWLLTDQLPTVGQARGKLVLMRRYEDAAELGTSSGFPLIWVSRGIQDDPSGALEFYDYGTYALQVQDRYKYDVDNKWEAFRYVLSSDGNNPGTILLNFLSTNGTSAYGHPFTYAKELNARLLKQENALKGWVILDFASPKLAELVYRQNK